MNDVLSPHEHGSAIVHLTQQVHDEFKRNRENKIKDALKSFMKNDFAIQLPYFMREYEEYENIRDLSVALKVKKEAIMKRASSDIFAKKLIADQLIERMFEETILIKTTPEIFNSASMRVAVGNPPGKNKSLGDAINWEALLESVPNGEDLHLISLDGDFYSELDNNSPYPRPFLSEEWNLKKKSTLFVYRTLSEFTKEHFDGIAFSFDKDKEELIDKLKDSGSFATTHGLIAELGKYSYFSLKEVNRILDAAAKNNQFGQIVTDPDISDFLKSVAIPRIDDIRSEEYKQILRSVIEGPKDSDIWSELFSFPSSSN